MITVRFPTGFSIQYNTGNYVERHAYGYTDIYEKKDGRWIAQVPTAGCVLELMSPCRMYQGVPAESDALLALTKEIRSLKRKVKP